MPPAPTLPLKDRIQRVQDRIEQAAQRTQRSASAIRLVTVTKTVPASIINEAIGCGLTELGENRIQEAQAKRADLKGPLVHHLLGTLQTNKARKAVELFDLIQSVDRPRLAEFLDRVAGELGKKQACLIEVKISKEASKSGVDVADVADFAKRFQQYPNLSLKGLMTIAPFDVPEPETRAAFQAMKKIFDGLCDVLGDNPILSMGMTDDFEIAIEEGSNMVRVGRAIFGERPK